MTYFIAGVIVGTFIPGPQQELVRWAATSTWTWLKSLASRWKSE